MSHAPFTLNDILDLRAIAEWLEDMEDYLVTHRYPDGLPPAPKPFADMHSLVRRARREAATQPRAVGQPVGVTVEKIAEDIYVAVGWAKDDPWANAVDRRDRMGMADPFTRSQRLCIDAAQTVLSRLAPSAGDVGEALRPEVLAFAHLMEAELKANDHKPGWKTRHALSLLMRLDEEKGELRDVLGAGTRNGLENYRLRVGSEAADVANFAMMIADVCGALSAAKGSK